jgi:rhamnulokinase
VIAGPVEATAIGNMLVQLRSIGALTGNLAELRSVVATSFATKRYEPSRSGPERWEQAADRLERHASVAA